MTIVPYTVSKARKVRGTHVRAGDTVYAICKCGLFFVWSYTNLETAKAMDVKLRGPESNTDLEANWRNNVEKLTPSSVLIV